VSTWIIPAFIAGFRSSPRNWKRLSKKEETPPSVYRWVQKFTPQLEAAFQKGRKHPVGTSWRMDETYIQVKGQWKYLYRAVDQERQTIDVLLTAHRDKKAARHFFKKAIG